MVKLKVHVGEWRLRREGAMEEKADSGKTTEKRTGERPQ